MAASAPLVLIHGTRNDASQWTRYHGLLPTSRVITLDLPGHGRRAAEPFTGETALAAISEAVEQAGTEPVLVGHSLGGYLAMVWAQHNPDRLSALVPIGATGDPSTRVTEVYRAFARLSTNIDHDRWAARSNRMLQLLGATETPDGTNGLAALPAAWQFVFDHGTPDTLRQVTCPVVLVNGQYDQMRLHERRYLAAAPNARAVTVSRATHLLPITHPVATAAVLQSVAAPGRD